MRNFEITLNRFFSVAADICNEILDFRPDLVIGLMHCGWLPLYASMELWKRTQQEPFPPMIRANIGSEKFIRFNRLETRPGVTDSFVGEYELDEGVAFFHAWLCEQIHWKKELQALIRERIGETQLERIFVVDEFIHEGSTWMLTLGLLNLIYPKAEVRFYNANLEYKDDFVLEWAKRHHPELLASDLFSNEYQMVRAPHRKEATQMVMGTEDIDSESLSWREIDLSSPNLDVLSSYLPASEWTELPHFAKQTILEEIEAHAMEFIAKPGKTKRFYPRLQPGILVMREIYRRGPVTAREISQFLDWPITKARYQVDRQISRGYLVELLDGPAKRFALSPRTKPDYDDDSPLIETYWVIPNRLMAGDFPGFESDYGKEQLVLKLRQILEAGITYFIDLWPIYRNRPVTYEPTLINLASESQREIHYTAISTPMRKLPRVKKIQTILAQVNHALNCGHIVYIHDYYNNVTETVLGCFLVEQGLNGAEAIKELERVRQGIRESWRRAPAKQSARQLVRQWKNQARF